MRQSIMDGFFESFVRDFLTQQFPTGNVPIWVVDALNDAGISISTNLCRDTVTDLVQSDQYSEIPNDNME